MHPQVESSGSGAAASQGGIAAGERGVAVGGDVHDIIIHHGVDPSVLKDIEAHLNEFLARFLILHRQLEEWKDLHNVLQDSQVRFSICRGYGLDLARRDEPQVAGWLAALTKASTWHAQHVERVLYEFSLNWEQCKLTLDQLRRYTMRLRHIGSAYEPGAQTGPPQMITLEHLRLEIDEALHDADRYNLADLIGSMAKQIDDYLFVVDKSLRDVAKEINQLPQQIRLTTLR